MKEEKKKKDQRESTKKFPQNLTKYNSKADKEVLFKEQN